MNRWISYTLVLVIMVMIGGVVYQNSLHNSYHYDDIHHIVGNQYITTIRNIPLFFTDTRTFSSLPQGQNHYRPLLLTSYALNYYFGKLRPAGYHVVNLAFHIGSAFLLFLIVQAMFIPTPSLPRSPPPPDLLQQVGEGKGGKTIREGGRKGNDGTGSRLEGGGFAAVAAGLIFLTTPFNSEVVNYISARSSVMCAFFYLLSFYWWIKYRSARGRGQGSGFREDVISPTPYYIASLLAFLLAMLTKEIAITLPGMLFLYDMYFNKTNHYSFFSPHRYTPYIPFVLVAGITGFLLRKIFCGNILAVGLSSSRSLGTQLFTAPWLLVKYIYMTIVPVRLSVEHPVGLSTSLWESSVLISLMVLMLIGCALLLLGIYRDVRYRIISFFGIWFFIALLPTTVIPLNAMFQENRGYLPGAGIVVIAGIVLNQGIRSLRLSDRARTYIAYSLLTATIVIYGGMTWSRNMVWKDDVTIWEDVVKKYPVSRNAPMALGRIQVAQNPDLAEQELKEILQKDPRNTGVMNNLANLYANMGKDDLAEEMYLKAIEIAPRDYKFHFNLAKIYKDRGEMELAAEEYREVLRLNQDHTVAAEFLAGLYVEMGKAEIIEGAFQLGTKKDPRNPALYRGLGIAYSRQQKWDMAAEAFEMVLKITPDDVQTRIDLGNSYMKNGRLDLAERELHTALKLEPGNRMAHQGLGIVYQQKDQYALALKHYKKAIEGRSGSPRVLNNIGSIYFAMGKTGKAIEAFQEALRLDPSYHTAGINLGRAYEGQERLHEAREEYIKVLQGGAGQEISEEVYREANRRLENLGRGD